MYTTLTELRSYLQITDSTSDDNMLDGFIAAAQKRIEDSTKRKFEAVANTVRYYDAVSDVDGRTLCLNADISYISSVTTGGSTLPATEYTTKPRNETPYKELIIKSTSTYYWTFTDAPEDAITVTGRWAVMDSLPITSIARATNVVTATMSDTSGLAPGVRIHVLGVADSTFNGVFTVSTVTNTAVTWAQSAANDTDTTGTILFTPPSIRQACTRLAGWLYMQQRNSQGDSDRPILAGEGVVIMPTTLPQDVQYLIREYVEML